MEIQNGLTEWKSQTEGARKYHMAYIEQSKVALANLIDIAPKEFNKTLFTDMSKISDTFKAEKLYVAISATSPNLRSIVRSLTVFGFEKIGKEEISKYTTDKAILLLSFTLTQENEYVDDI